MPYRSTRYNVIYRVKRVKEQAEDSLAALEIPSIGELLAQRCKKVDQGRVKYFASELTVGTWRERSIRLQAFGDSSILLPNTAPVQWAMLNIESFSWFKEIEEWITVI